MQPQASGSAAGRTGASAGRGTSAEVATLRGDSERRAGADRAGGRQRVSQDWVLGKLTELQLPRAYLHVICMELQEWT